MTKRIFTKKRKSYVMPRAEAVWIKNENELLSGSATAGAEGMPSDDDDWGNGSKRNSYFFDDSGSDSSDDDWGL